MTIKKSEFETVVVLGDTHGKMVDQSAFDCTLQVIKDVNPDRLIHNGDLGDYTSVSHWLNNKKLQKEGLRLDDDLQDAVDILNKLSTVVSSKCIKEVIIGNHDAWVMDYIDEHPELEKSFNLFKKYAVNGFKVYPEFTKLNVGKLVVMHNIDKLGGDFHTKGYVTRMGCSVLYGHFHDHQKYSLIQYRGKHSATSCGCLCRFDMPYLNGNPTRWSHGFSVIYLHKKTGFFTQYFVEITNGNTVFNGKFYSGSKIVRK